MMTIIASSHAVLVRWNILKNLTDNSDHFIGLELTLNLGRMSTAIITFDFENGQGSTYSESTYQTLGPPGKIHPDALYVLEQVLASRNIEHEWKYPVQGGKDD